MKPVTLILLLVLGGCHAIPLGALYAVEGVAAASTIARNIVGIDVSISQEHPPK